MEVEKISIGKVEKLKSSDGSFFYTLEILCKTQNSEQEERIMFFSDNAEKLKIKK
jgi:hypothetical protein